MQALSSCVFMRVPALEKGGITRFILSPSNKKWQGLEKMCVFLVTEWLNKVTLNLHICLAFLTLTLKH